MAPFALPNSLFRPSRPAVSAQQREREALERIITVVSGSISAGDRTSAMLEIEHALELLGEQRYEWRRVPYRREQTIEVRF